MNAESSQQRFLNTWSEIVVRAWSDPEFKQRVMSDPVSVLREHGVAIPQGTMIQVVEGDRDPSLSAEAADQPVVYIPLPNQPTGELSDQALEQIAGGSFSRHAVRTAYDAVEGVLRGRASMTFDAGLF